jgi:hypothetical protein
LSIDLKRISRVLFDGRHLLSLPGRFRIAACLPFLIYRILHFTIHRHLRHHGRTAGPTRLIRGNHPRVCRSRSRSNSRILEFYRSEHDALGIEGFSDLSSPVPSLVTRIAMTEGRIHDYCWLRVVEIYRPRLARGKSTWFLEIVDELACDLNLYGRKNDAGYWPEDAEDFLQSAARFRRQTWWLPISKWLVKASEPHRSSFLGAPFWDKNIENLSISHHVLHWHDLLWNGKPLTVGVFVDFNFRSRPTYTLL